MQFISELVFLRHDRMIDSREWAGRQLEGVKGSLHEHASLSLEPQDPFTKLGVVLRTCNPNAGYAKMRVRPDACRLASPVEAVSFTFMEGLRLHV